MKLENSVSWTPPSSWYCNHRSVSMISAAARKRRMAASPRVRLPLRSSSPASARVASSVPALKAAPAIPIPLRNERRGVVLGNESTTCEFVEEGVFCDDTVEGKSYFFIILHSVYPVGWFVMQHVTVI